MTSVHATTIDTTPPFRRYSTLKQLWSSYRCGVFRPLVRVFEATQVELHGQYSVDRLQQWLDYQQSASVTRAVLVCLGTPFPIILGIILIDLIPLEPPQHGINSPKAWIRAFVVTSIASYASLQQLHNHLSTLQVSIMKLLVISLIAGSLSTASVILMAHWIGYPLPFTFILIVPVWRISMKIGFGLIHRHELRAQPQLQAELRQYRRVSACQTFMTIVYPVFNYFFSHASTQLQTILVFMLQLLKLFMKNWLAHSLHETDGAKPETVIFNIEIFHSLFVALSMQNMNSINTVILQVALDSLQAWFAFLDIRTALRNLQESLSQYLEPQHNRLLILCPLHLARQLLVLDPAILSRKKPPSGKIQSFAPNEAQIHPSETLNETEASSATSVAPIKQTNRVVIASSPHHDDILTHAPSADRRTMPPGPMRRGRSLHLMLLTPQERDHAMHQILRLLFMTEFLVLVMFTEIIVPFIYCK